MGSSLYVLDYSKPAFVGTMVSFNCSQPKEELVGPNSAQCMEDGQWVPDPNQLQISCKGIMNFTYHPDTRYTSINTLALMLDCRKRYDNMAC